MKINSTHKILATFFIIFPVILYFYNPEISLEAETKAEKNPTAEINPTSIEINQALNLYNQGKYSEALKIYLSLIDRNLEIAIVSNNICATYNGLKEYEKAVGYCQKALELNPNFELAQNNLRWAQNKLAESK